MLHLKSDYSIHQVEQFFLNESARLGTARPITTKKIGMGNVMKPIKMQTQKSIVQTESQTNKTNDTRLVVTGIFFLLRKIRVLYFFSLERTKLCSKEESSHTLRDT